MHEFFPWMDALRAGPAILRQMSFRVSAIMSAGLGLGYLAAGQFFRALLGR